MDISKQVQSIRIPQYPIHPIFLNRWSPRAMTGESMTDEELFPLFEAARWAPSSFNSQPWKILYAKREEKDWELFTSFLIDFNKQWCKNAAVLMVMLSCKNFEKSNKPSVTHSYDTGAAWMSLALEGSLRGYVVHGMSGFDYEKAYLELGIPPDYAIEAMAAIGKRADKSALPEELSARETPSGRKPFSECIKVGRFS